VKDIILSKLLDKLINVASWTAIISGPDKEQSEVNTIRVLNRIVDYRQRQGYDEIVRLAQEALETGDAEPLIDILEQMLQ
jgi:hypothetical protein